MKIVSTGFVLFCSLVLMGCGSFPEEVTIDPVPVPNEPPQRVIMALGDSLTEGYGIDEADAYPAQLQRLLATEGYDYRVINGGISGETTTGMGERLDWMLSQNPDLIILTIGANDAIRGIDLSITEQNIRSIVQTIQDAGIPLVFSGMEIYENLGAEYVNRFQAIYPTIATEYDLPFIPFFLEGVAGDPSLNIADQIHPNREGYKIVVEQNIWPVLEGVLKE